MENIKHIYVIIYLILLIITIRIIFKKGEIHFKLLKELFPKAFIGINSFYNPILFLYLIKLDIYTILWFVSPIYYSRRSFLSSKSQKSKLLNSKLVNNNIKLLIYMLIMIVWTVAIRYLILK